MLSVYHLYRIKSSARGKISSSAASMAVRESFCAVALRSESRLRRLCLGCFCLGCLRLRRLSRRGSRLGFIVSYYDALGFVCVNRRVVN